MGPSRLSRQLLPQRVPQPSRPLGHLRRPQGDRPVGPPLTFRQLATTRVDKREPERRPPVPRVGGPLPPQRGLGLAPLPGQQQPEIERAVARPGPRGLAVPPSRLHDAPPRGGEHADAPLRPPVPLGRGPLVPLLAL